MRRGLTSEYPRLSTRGLRASVIDWVVLGLIIRMLMSVMVEL